MPLDTEPQPATDIISFGDGQGNPAKITFNVPLPGYQTGRRFVRLDVGLANGDFLQAANDAGEDLATAIKLRQKDDHSGFTFDAIAAAELFRRKLYESGATPSELAPLDEAIAALRLASADGNLSSARDARDVLLQVT